MKNTKLAIIAIFLLAAFAVLLVACNLGGSNAAISAEVVRIHIRANSNSSEDQAVKLLVRDSVTAYLTDRLSGCSDKAEALNVLEEDKNKIANIADNALYNNGFNYKTTVCVKNDYFPDKEYDGYVFPAGYYDALMIYLGEGVGDNWWCVAFPPLCFVPEGDGERVQYKSWVKEILDKIFAD